MNLIGDTLGQPVKTMDGSWTLRHPDYGECYHSDAGALFEAKALYIQASGWEIALQNCLSGDLAVVDIGLGLGYNASATIAAWWEAEHPPEVVLLSLELNAELFKQFSQGTGAWQENWPALWLSWLQSLQPTQAAVWETVLTHPQGKGTLLWRVVLGNAYDCASDSLKGRRWNFFWQDAFSPEKNPQLWSASWFTCLAEYAAPEAVLMSYSVARVVKEALASSGWKVSKLATPGPKRSWLKATWDQGQEK